MCPNHREARNAHSCSCRDVRNSGGVKQGFTAVGNRAELGFLNASLEATAGADIRCQERDLVGLKGPKKIVTLE